MLQSILSAVFLYHVIKAILRAIRRRKDTADAPPAAAGPANAAINAHTADTEHATPMELAIHRAFGSRPWVDFLVETLRRPLGARNIVFGILFFGVGLLLTLAMLWVLFSNPADSELLLGGLITLAIGVGCCWMGATYWREGMQLLRIRPHETVVTGATHYAAAKPQPLSKGRKKPDKQFEEL